MRFSVSCSNVQYCHCFLSNKYMRNICSSYVSWRSRVDLCRNQFSGLPVKVGLNSHYIPNSVSCQFQWSSIPYLEPYFEVFQHHTLHFGQHCSRHAAHKWLGHIVVRNIVGCVLLRSSLFSGPIEPKQCRTKPGILKETDQETVHGGLWQVTSLSTCWKLDVLNQYLMRPCSVRYEKLSCINNFHVSNKINLTNKFKHFLKMCAD